MLRAGPAGQPLLLSHRQQLAPRVPQRCAVISMPFEGTVVSVPEMLDLLVANGRTDADAARELSSAVEERKIVLATRNGTVLSEDDRRLVADFIRKFPSRTISIIGEPTALWLSEQGVGGWRVQFEAVCGLKADRADRLDVPNRRIVTDEALVQEGLDGVRSGKWQNAHKAAEALAPRAEGASISSTIKRLEGKMRKRMN